jgi:hypothetical protein
MTSQLSQFVCGLYRDTVAADKPVDSSDPRYVLHLSLSSLTVIQLSYMCKILIQLEDPE